MQQLPPSQQPDAEGATACADSMTSTSEAIAKNIFMISFQMELPKTPLQPWERTVVMIIQRGEAARWDYPGDWSRARHSSPTLPPLA
ncbi:hypothetical protein BH18VER1_BH18VER1_10470 [soil metagenome]